MLTGCAWSGCPEGALHCDGFEPPPALSYQPDASFGVSGSPEGLAFTLTAGSAPPGIAVAAYLVEPVEPGCEISVRWWSPMPPTVGGLLSVAGDGFEAASGQDPVTITWTATASAERFEVVYQGQPGHGGAVRVEPAAVSCGSVGLD